MPTPKKGPRLGGSPAHQRLILSNLSTQLFEHGAITTTEAKARTLRPHAEKLITKAVKAHHGQNPLHQRREVLKTIHDKGVVHVLFTEIAPTFAERPGGYTRITKLGPRKGDNAPMARIALVTEPYIPIPATGSNPIDGTIADKAKELDTRTGQSVKNDDSSDENTGMVGAPQQQSPVEPLETTHSLVDQVPLEELTLMPMSGPYTRGKTSGHLTRLVNDEYVHAEAQSNGAHSIMWSSGTPWRDFLQTMTELSTSLSPTEPPVTVWSRADDEDEYEGSLDELVRETSSLDVFMAHSIIRYPSLSLVWRRPFDKASWSSRAYGEVAVVASPGVSLEMPLVFWLLALTGTETVRTVLADYPSALDEVLAAAVS